MRKALSLIELVFTIVIIALVFTVIPKIVFALNKSDAFAIKQDALFNGVTLMQMISKLDWDENSTITNDILGAANGDGRFTCDNTTDYYRQGGFIGSRNCKENNASFSASAIGKDPTDTNTSVFNDIDDFDNNGSITSMYRLHTSVYYINDSVVGNGSLIDLNQSNPLTSGTSNLKRIHVDITTSYTGNKKNVAPERIAQFDYVSSNIGKTFLNKRTW
jgi:hypothetical protein